MTMPGELCSRCKNPSVLYQQYSGRRFCADHLAADIIIRVKRTIRCQGGLGKRSVLTIIPDGPGFFPLLYILGVIIGSRPGMEIVILDTLGDMPSRSGAHPDLPSQIRIRKEKVDTGSYHDAATYAGADRIIRCTTLDETAAGILKSVLSGTLFPLLPEHEHDLRILTPLREIPVNELMILATQCSHTVPGLSDLPSDSVHQFLSDLSEHHPSVPFSLLKYHDHLLELGKRE